MKKHVKYQDFFISAFSNGTSPKSKVIRLRANKVLALEITVLKTQKTLKTDKSSLSTSLPHGTGLPETPGSAGAGKHALGGPRAPESSSGSSREGKVRQTHYVEIIGQVSPTGDTITLTGPELTLKE